MPESTKKTPNRPGRPPAGKSLTPQAVAEAAARIIDAEGIGELSMRRLGQSLGVEAMALYNHFSDKEAILDAVAALALARIPIPTDRGAWRSRIKGICRAFRELARRHPNLFIVTFARPVMPTAALPVVEGMLGAFADAGLNADAQVSAFHVCHLYVRGFCLWELQTFERLPDGEVPQVLAVGTEFPRVAAAKHAIFTPDLEREFENGLDMILRGLTVQRDRG
jgi:TetR/AcrR family transcriptional regulator, tetracycline repressor protein